MVAIYIGIGSNIDAKKNISKAIDLLRNRFPSIVFSRIFESEAVGFSGDNFLNLVAKFASTDLPSDFVESVKLDSTQFVQRLVEQLKLIENEVGRQRNSKRFSARKIDIDVLLVGELISREPIELPRGEILENAYVLWPLAELAGTLMHISHDPSERKSYQQYWQEFDKSSQKLKPIEQNFILKSHK